MQLYKSIRGAIWITEELQTVGKFGRLRKLIDILGEVPIKAQLAAIVYNNYMPSTPCISPMLGEKYLRCHNFA